MRRSAGALVVALAAGAYSGAVLALERGSQPSADSHYHFSMAREIAQGALVPDVARSLPFTVLHDMPVDHYWGYHVLLAPFALAGDPETGMKAATVALFAAIFASLYLLLRALDVPYAAAWTALPALFSTQDWRYLQVRGGQLTLPLLFAMTHVAFFDGTSAAEPRRGQHQEDRARRRRAWLVAIGYAALLSYHGGVVLLPFHVAGVAALLLARQPGARERAIDPAFTALGMALGLTINPYMDARASTWRFFAFHVGKMGRDTAHLYDDQDVAEFHGFPFHTALQHPEWLVLLALTLAAVAWTFTRARSPRTVPFAGMALMGIVLVLQAMRTREYAVPIAFCLLAVLAPRPRPSYLRAPLLAAALGVATFVHGVDTVGLPRSLPTHEYDGARALLEANGDHPVLNIAEADFGMLRWQWEKVVCVQALSRYFLYPYPALFHDVWELHNRADTSAETPAILRRFWERGVRLVAAHRLHNRMQAYAADHPELLHLVFRSPINGAAIYELDPSVATYEAPSSLP